MHKVFSFGLFILCCAMLFTGCCSNKAAAGVNGNLLSYQQQVDRLEEELRNRDRTVETAVRELRVITSRSNSMEGTVDELIQLFGEYQRRVEQLLYDYNKIRTEAKNTNEYYNSTSYYINYTYNMYDYWVYNIF